jgi:hypothetical protein
MVDRSPRPTPPNPRRRVELWRVVEAMREARSDGPATPGTQLIQPPPSGQPFWDPSILPTRPNERRWGSRKP